MTDDRTRGYEAANQGLGMPGDLSLAGQDAYNREMAHRSEASMGGLMPRIGMPIPPMDVGGIAFLLALPLLAIWFVLMDLVHGWRWYRVMSFLLALLFTGAIFAYSVYLGVQLEMSGQIDNSENDPTVALLLNVGAGGLFGVILTLIPRTIATVAILSGLVTAYNTWLAPLW